MVQLIKDFARHQVRKYPYLRYHVKKLQRQAGRYSMGRLEACLGFIHRTDTAIKGAGSLAPELALERLVIALASTFAACDPRQLSSTSRGPRRLAHSGPQRVGTPRRDRRADPSAQLHRQSRRTPRPVDSVWLRRRRSPALPSDRRVTVRRSSGARLWHVVPA